jgi:hypothetical protein
MQQIAETLITPPIETATEAMTATLNPKIVNSKSSHQAYT